MIDWVDPAHSIGQDITVNKKAPTDNAKAMNKFIVQALTAHCQCGSIQSTGASTLCLLAPSEKCSRL